jgi:hypothetical protein
MRRALDDYPTRGKRFLTMNDLGAVPNRPAFSRRTHALPHIH